MSIILRKNLEKFITIDGKTFDEVLQYFNRRIIKKKQNIMEEGDYCSDQYFVEQGCLRKFFMKENGIEQTTEFALEQWWLTDTFAFERRLPTTFFIQAVEPTTILHINHDQREALLKKHPIMERYFRMVYQRSYAASERRIRYLYEFTREELYFHFEAHYPEFVQRIPQYLLASFLGFTPEYLSEIRSKNRS
ncbi:Crp/Fnr family transcriptional regulator [Galbibacter marinus]|uniref:Crp/Fnr family transcriptional regulator n=1 Tax=Galbibacter marinus TaxID=555500 RepID=K2PTC1_9FLAO|nr:Crp/Fnr family transcriptional regulator [Galbibacter marinus]EKF54814.1 Crp/Fnr family transcriptional regulator [Galbibacter marinus]